MAHRGFVPCDPRIYVHVPFISERMIEVEKQVVSLATLPAPHDVRPGEATARAGESPGICKRAGIPISLAIAEGTSDRTAVTGGNEECVSAQRYAGCDREGTVWRPRGATVVPVRIE